MKRHSAHADDATAAASERRQAEYLLALLSKICRRTNFRINMYERAIAVAEAGGDVGYACAFRHLTRVEEHDQQVLEGMIDNLQRRFPPREDEIPPITRRAPCAVR